MEDDNKIKKIITTIIIIAIIIGLFIASFFIYKKIITNNNTKTFTEYLLKNGYTKNKNNYTKEVINGNKNIKYYFDDSSYVLNKEIKDYTNYKQIVTATITYKNNDNIETDYVVTGINKNNNYSSIIYSATLDTNNKFTCKIIKDGGFDTQCPKIKNEILTFKQEVKKLLKKSNTNAKYIKNQT